MRQYLVMDEKLSPAEAAEKRLEAKRRQIERDLGEQARQAQESGELRHLYGKPLDLSQDTSEWLVHRFIKQAGFSHPLLEHGKELEEPAREADKVMERLGRRRQWLLRPEARCTPRDVHAFNEMRRAALDEYREKLVKLNRAIRDFNLRAPTALHRRAYDVDGAVAAAADDIPALPLENPESSAGGPARSVSILGRMLRRRNSMDRKGQG